MRTSRSTSLRLYALLLTALVSAAHARAGTVTMYTNSNAWYAAAGAAGLTVDYTTFGPGIPPILPFPPPPPLSPFFKLGPATFVVDSGGFAFDHLQNLHDILVDFDDVLEGSFVFGLGYDYTIGAGGFGGGPPTARIQVTDFDNVRHLAERDSVTSGFLGIIGTSAFDPDNLGWQGNEEIQLGTGSLPFRPNTLDNLAVAYAVPEPGTGLLLGLTMAGLCVLRKPRRPAGT
jgi:hypothetical protein